MGRVEVRPAEWRWNNVSAGAISQEARERIVHKETLGIAYLFVTNQIRALHAWDTIQTSHRPHAIGWERETDALLYFNSHYNAVYNYMGDCIVGGSDTLLESQSYKELFQATHDGFEALDRKELRYIFLGEEGLAEVENPDAPISLEELDTWIKAHTERSDGLVDASEANPSPISLENIKEIRSGFDLVKYFHFAGIEDKEGGWTTEMVIAAFKRFPEETYQLAVWKLACGMAILDQLAHEAANLSTPIPSDYRPNYPNLEDEEPLPPLEELWDEAYGMLGGVVDINSAPLQDLLPDSLYLPT